MSLFKQLLIVISALFLMVFSINFIISVNNIRDYLQGEAEIHAQDTATSLGLSLSPYMINETDPVIETMMNAIFDRGYYQEIKLLNVEHKPLVVLTNIKQYEGVPDWFIKLIPMKTIMAKSEISSGWTISGTVYVTLNPGYAYLKLYQQAKNGFYYSLVIFLLSMCFLYLVLRMTLRSLRRIDQMALTIANGRFETIETLPWTTEVRNVTISMNRMSDKIQNAIASLNSKLDVIGTKLQQDDLTGLYKKSSFEIAMKKLFVSRADAFILMIKIDELGNLVKELAPESIDVFLTDFACLLTDKAKQGGAMEISNYRFYGAEFVVLAENVSAEQIKKFAESLSHAFTQLGKKYNKPDIAHIGIVPFNPFSSTDNILLAANEAYEQARLIGANRYCLRLVEERAKDIAEWKSLVFNVIENEAYQLSFLGQIETFTSRQIMMEEACTQVFDEKGEAVAIGTFVSIAEKFAKIVELDKGVTKQVIEYIATKNLQHAVAVNLSTRTIKSSDYRNWLSRELGQHQAISKQLIFSISAYAVNKEVAVYKEFIDFVHSLNARVMIKRFETQSMAPDVAKDLNPDFIRLARDIGKGIAKDAGKQAFVETLLEIARLLDIRLLAENIQDQQDYQCMKDIGIDGASL